jgi:hypothetical protein
VKRNLKVKAQSAKLLSCFAETCFYHGLKILKLAGFGVRVDVHLIDFFATKALRRKELF